MATPAKPVAAEDHQAVSADTALSGKPEYPGQTLGLVALVLSFFMQIPALILGILAWAWSNRAGVSNVPAKVAVAVSATLMVIGLLVLIGWIVLIASSLGQFGDMGGFGRMGPDFFS
jgi:small-conductance mechanosensitive channel